MGRAGSSPAEATKKGDTKTASPSFSIQVASTTIGRWRDEQRLKATKQTDKCYEGNCRYMCEKCKETEAIIQEWANKQGHDRCWYYPDLFRRLAEVFEMDLKPGSLPPRQEFEMGCLRYQREEYSNNDTNACKEANENLDNPPKDQ